MRPALRLLPCGLLALLMLAGCGHKASGQRPQGEGFQYGGMALDSPARTIISLSPSSTEVLLSFGASRFLVGRTSSCDWPTFARKYPVVMTGTKPDYETIGKLLQTPDHKPLKPDLFVYDPALFNDADVAMMAQNSRIKPFPLDGDTVDEFMNECKKLSTYYTGETFMSDYIDRITTARKGAQADPVTPKPTVALILPGEGSEHMIAGKDSFYADEIRAATGEPVGPPGNKYVTLNAESLIQMNPDIIFTAGPSDSFVHDSRFQNLSAIKNNHIGEVNQDVAVRRGCRVDEFITQLHNTMAGFMHGKEQTK